MYRHEVQLHYTLVHHRTRALIMFGTALFVLVSTTLCYTPYASLLFSICSALDG